MGVGRCAGGSRSALGARRVERRRFGPTTVCRRRPSEADYRYGPGGWILRYARVSTAKRNLDRQLDALAEAGITLKRIYPDQRSGASADQPELRVSTRGAARWRGIRLDRWGHMAGRHREPWSPSCRWERGLCLADPGSVPMLTAEQRREALRQAMAARAARKQLLDAIAQGQESIPTVLERAKTDTVVGRTRVTALLTSLPGYGPARVSALMQRTGIAPARRVAGLGERQRQALCDALAMTRRHSRPAVLITERSGCSSTQRRGHHP
jgi:Resolvase, N terminal domain